VLPAALFALHEFETLMREFLQNAILLVVLATSTLSAQQQPSVAGRWEGSIQVPSREVGIVVDLAKNEKGEWIGSLDLPAQGAKGSPLSNISVKDAAVGFQLLGIPGTPAFQGKLSADGKSISGDFAQAGKTFPFQLKRTGDAQVTIIPKSTPITKQMEGTWEGVLDAGGHTLRLVLKLSTAADGAAVGTIDSPDQNAKDIALNTITQKGSSVHFDIRAINGSYDGNLNKDGMELMGEWTQGGVSLPLTFKRSTKTPEDAKK